MGVPAMPGSSVGRPLPLVGREEEIRSLIRLLDAAERGSPSTVFLAGDGGIGKTRLAEALVDAALRRGWTAPMGRAYPVETGVPYALFSDALLPTLKAVEPSTLAVLSRGGEYELSRLFPSLELRTPVPRSSSHGDAAEIKSRLLWNFSQFLGRLSTRRPLLIVLENLQWADESSLELLHFVARQLQAHRIAILCTYNDAQRGANSALANTERSLVALGVATVMRLGPLSQRDTYTLLADVFAADADAIGEFAATLFDRTRGNPFFIDQMIKSLVDSGRLRREGASWVGWETTDLELPHTIRDALVARLARLSPAARSIADLAAVFGSRVSYAALAAVSQLPDADIVGAIDELRRDRVLVDVDGTEDPHYDFTHPMLQATLYAELGNARARLLHGSIAAALEQLYGAAAPEHADELAVHFSRAASRESAPKAARYLARAGRSALGRYATREAATYLAAALELFDRDVDGELTRAREDLASLVEDLARVRQRNGEYDRATVLWRRALEYARERNDVARAGSIERRLGLTSFWAGQVDDAFAHYASALEAAAQAGDERLSARVRIAQASAYQQLGRAGEALGELGEALRIAERVGDAGMLARIHRALMQLHMFIGHGPEAHAHGERAIDYSKASGERAVTWSAHWGIAVLSGLTGNTPELALHVREAERIAHDLGSPVLSAWTSEVSIEYASGIGDWHSGLALADRTIPVARAVGPRSLLPRLLVWTGLMHLGRGDTERARMLFDESWGLSRAGDSAGRDVDVNTVVPAHIGMAALALATGQRREAIRLGEAGVAIADRSGYIAWAVHRLIPIIIEAALWLQDFERAERYGERLRAHSTRMGHALGMAWATASDALVARLRDHDDARAVALLSAAADQLEAVPFVFDAARIRRNLAQLLVTSGDRDAAARELRRAHDVFARIGAENELNGVRDELRELGARPPSRTIGEGAGALTGRELEIARLVAERKSNKEIGVALRISSRTVSTHLSNVFAKLGVRSRGELTDRVRQDETLRR